MNDNNFIIRSDKIKGSNVIFQLLQVKMEYNDHQIETVYQEKQVVDKVISCNFDI